MHSLKYLPESTYNWEHVIVAVSNSQRVIKTSLVNKGNNKITELRTILQRESQNS
jgi:hypothetical protein